jgi:hypothetical protein
MFLHTDITTIPGFTMMATNMSSILVEYIGKPLLDGYKTLSNWVLNISKDQSTWNFLKVQLDKISSMFYGSIGLIGKLFTTFFTSLGIADKNGDMGKSFINFFALLVDSMGRFLSTILSDKSFLSTLQKHIRLWGEYFRLVTSPDSLQALITWSDATLKWQSLSLEIGMMWINLTNSLAPLANVLGFLIPIIEFGLNLIKAACMVVNLIVMTIWDGIQFLYNAIKHLPGFLVGDKEGLEKEQSKATAEFDKWYKDRSGTFSDTWNALDIRPKSLVSVDKSGFTQPNKKELVLQEMQNKQTEAVLGMAQFMKDTGADVTTTLKALHVTDKELAKALNDYAKRDAINRVQESDNSVFKNW